MSQTSVNYTLEESVAVIRLDDGKVNALSHAVLDALHSAFDRAENDDSKAIVVVGRKGRFSAGFDLSVMSEGIESANLLAVKGGKLAIRIYDSPKPVVLAVTGHALAMGAILLMSADERIGADGPFKIGLNEVTIGMTLPGFALIIAKARLSRRYLARATSGAEIFTPGEAVDVGFLDRVVLPDDVIPEAIARARLMAEKLNPAAHMNTKRTLRKIDLEQLRQSLEDGGPF